jgi:integrase
MKRFERPMLGFLSREEMLAIISEPSDSWTSQRDHLLLRMLYNTGARVSEIIGVTLADVVLDGAACAPARQGAQATHGAAVALDGAADQGVAAAQSAVATDIGAVAQPRWPGNDARNVTQRLTLAVKAATAAQPQLATRRISPHHPPHDGHAPAAGGVRHQRHRAVAGPREPDDNSPIRRG